MSASPQRQLVVFPDAEALAEAAAQRLVDRVRNATHPAICLTGGSTPKRLYKLLAAPPWRDRIPWNEVHWFIGDDRFVPQDNPLSNMGMARRSFLDACAPAQNIHAMPTTMATPEQAARIYEQELQSFRGKNRKDLPLFDLVLMGVGPDGHTASLFPKDPALAEEARYVVGVDHANVAPFVPRISLTLPCLAKTQEMLFLVAGPDKRDIMRRIFSGEDLPAARARAGAGETLWLLDKAAVPPDVKP